MKTMRFYITSFHTVILTLLLFVFSSALKAQELITINSGEWPPYLSENSLHHGFFSHVVTTAFSLESIDINYQFKPWKRTFEETKLGLVNASIGWSKTKDREADFIFSEPIIIGKSVLFHLKTNTIDWDKFSDLRQYTIGGTLGYEYKFEHEMGVHIERVATDEINFRKLLKGRITLFPSDKDAGYMILNQHFRSKQIAQITYHSKAYDQTSYRLIFPKKRPDSIRLLALFNRGLAKLRSSGEFAKIMNNQESGEYSKQLISERR